MKSFSVVVAATASSMGIGRRGGLPWKIPEDMAFFKQITLFGSNSPNKNISSPLSSPIRKSNTSSPLTDVESPPNSKVSTASQEIQNHNTLTNAVIMGRKTWESIPLRFRPLEGRTNVILSRNPNIRKELDLPESVIVAASLLDALEILSNTQIGEIFVIGGGAVYEEAMRSPFCNRIYLTEVNNEIPDLDAFFPKISACDFKLVSRSSSQQHKEFSYRFLEFERILEDSFDNNSKRNYLLQTECCNLEEQQYLDLVREIIENGNLRGDRTGTGTLSIFGVQMRFSLRNGIFPLLTTKKVFWRGVAEELVWFVQGSTNAKELSEKGIHIWDGNGSREFLDSRGLVDRQEGDLGPVYGFQWRHFGAEYKDMFTDYNGKGIDQLMDCIHKIKTSPEDRRIIMTAWNPTDLDKMALPPCHMFCQFYVSNGELSCQMYQRSADMGLGVPFNIASYALLTVMMAQVCNLKPGDFVHSIGDAHVYVNHVEALKIQLQRTPKAFPRLLLNPNVTEIDKFEFSDFTIEDYNPEGIIKMKMAV
eukprot:gene7088-9673_t